MTRSCQPPARSLAELLDEPASSSLGSLTRQARCLQRIQGAVRDLLQAPLDEHVQVARADPATLVLAVDSPAWASRLRFRAPDLLPELRSALGMPQLAGVRIIVCPPTAGPAPTAARASDVGPSSVKLLRDVADGLEDQRLAEVLRRLADRGRPD